MLKEERFGYILDIVKQGQTVTYDGLAAGLKVSEDTVRRDIEYLHQNGLLSKVRGGAIARSKNPLSFEDRTGFLSEGKEVIALKVQPLLKNGYTIFMDGGTTICEVAKHFSADSAFRVVTNNQALVPILSKFKGIEIIVLGGTYNRETQTNLGAKTCEEAMLFIADVYLMGTCAISKTYGITTSVKEDGEVKRAMLKVARKTIVLSNSEKIGTCEHFRICDLNQIGVLVTELPGNDSRLDQLRDTGTSIF